MRACACVRELLKALANERGRCARHMKQPKMCANLACACGGGKKSNRDLKIGSCESVYVSACACTCVRERLKALANERGRRAAT